MSLANILFAEVASFRSKLPMADWPDWLVLVVAGVSAVVGIWVLVKMLKFALWLACAAVLVIGVLLVAGMILK